MKKLMNVAYVGAIALLSMGLTACSSGDDAVVDNPNYNPTDNTVKVQLAIALASNTGSQMRMANNIVQGQATPEFRGMQDMRLIAFNKWVAKSEVDGDLSGVIKPFDDKVINLGTMNAFDKESQNAKIYNDVSIPVGTKAFLFYGRAKKEPATSYPAGATDDEKSHLDHFHTGLINAPTNYTGPVKEYVFSLQPIQPDIYATTDGDNIVQHGVNERAKELVNYVKDIRAVNVNHVIMHTYLSAFQPTAGSSASIEAAVQNLWDNIRAIPVTTDGEIADVAAIKAAIQGGGKATIDDTTNKVTIIMNKMMGYPANIFLPDGAAAIDWEDPANPLPIVSGHNGTVYVAPLNTYVFPAELLYRANTSIGVSDIESVSESYGNDSWEMITSNTSKYKWDGTVSGSTRSIALKNPIEYAVGRLDLQVKAASANLKDYAGNTVTVPATGFPISAVLIGNQKNVDFQFGPIESSTAYTIYDNEMTEVMAALPNAAQGTNKTLVLESGSELQQVNVCVELTNTSGTSFVSKNGIVPAGGKFYLVGLLDLTNSTEYTGDNGTPKMIFKQDYVTKATFTIAELGNNNDVAAGLGAAYNVIPDLKTPQLEVAFSVNLAWQEGLSFNTVF